MKLSALLLLPLTTTSAFVLPGSSTFRATSSAVRASYELEPEPEGGEEIEATSTLPGSRLKNMGENNDLKSDDGQVYNFWMSATAPGSSVKEFRTRILKEASRKANFPGFRKGQVPPYAQPQITGFALQEAVIQTCESVISAYGLKALSGSDGSVDVKENVQEICKTFKTGDDFVFTGTFAATLDPEKVNTAAEIIAELEEEVPATEEEEVAAVAEE
eukprot:CAMPEP_0196819358 /NCGR_PEP_ID=MMETSP1362-20130617/70197_1 /TAXON_ID=163516 /ORGANISM="Leptocylindrus danicus, Strain CCMP1856" /LENGTH=216 /DNA_ID=CAMNT_0042197813 /DNA_START=73 /DNA_END=723 /DNA_ORIENTATION=-